MKSAISFLLLLTACITIDAQSDHASWTGSYNGNIYGTPSVLSLTESGTQITGKIDASGYIYELSGNLENNQLTGTMTDGATGGQMNYSATLQGDLLLMKLITLNMFGQPSEIPLQFQRARELVRQPFQPGGNVQGQGNPSNAPPGTMNQRNPSTMDQGATTAQVNLDYRLVGGWRHTSVYSSNEFGTVSEWYMNIYQNGTYTHGDGQMAGGDGGTSFEYQSGNRTTGKWKTENSKVYVNVGQGWEYHADYEVDAQNILFKFSNGEKELWERFR